jgi:Zn-finger nucleic acid-binding protein
MFRTSAFCPKCGARADRVEAGPESTRCPGCKGPLGRVALADAHLLECGDCDGVWLDAAEFERVCADREAQAAVIHRWGAAAPVAVGAPVRYRPCIRCGKMMNRVNFSRMSGTIVDVCRGHGTFLDAGELHAIVTFIQQGGVERAREREIDELREERRRPREAQAAADLRHRAPDSVSSGGWDATALSEVIRAIVGE